MKTRLTFREDIDFQVPTIILPSDHSVVTSIIMYKHKELMLKEIQAWIACLREKYSVLKSKRTVQKVILQYAQCKRFNAKPTPVNFVPLPEDRIRAAIFEVTGIDFVRPVLKFGKMNNVAQNKELLPVAINNRMAERKPFGIIYPFFF
ncbi:integrase catalytic domain-containing protein [Trichonephila inaurata madagascariensis]|uniref:Integrase catalytic domain-containing protein n=1 Tax=Trichonephila inaurata madagascariensis TaxID=2747483 RepID=A0A8X7C499_9ARAC|nr:integrase catalytic domain-containing protein [Trichonephila inaurata madagascariensis]